MGQAENIPGEEILYRQGESKIQHLSIIIKGEVIKYVLNAEGVKEYPETFGPGNFFGAISLLLNKQVSLRTVQMLEETSLLNISKEIFLDLCQRYPAFNDYFMQHFGQRMLTQGYLSLFQQKDAAEGPSIPGEMAFRQRVREVYNPQMHTLSMHSPIREVAQQMTFVRRGYTVLVDDDRKPVGMITDIDLRQKVVAKGHSIDAPASSIMSSPLLEIEADAFAYSAMLKMFRRKVNHLLVLDQGKILGIVSRGKLLNQQSRSPFLFVQSLGDEHSPARLAKRWAEVPQMISQLLERGTRPEIVNQIVSTIADHITHNVIRRTLKRLGPAPTPFAFIAMGSEGRREQTLSTDQDNALIYSDVPADKAAEVSAYFLELGQKVSDELAEIGFTYCKGELMASNPRWNQPLAQWKEYFAKWIGEPTIDNVLMGSTFVDSRVVFGENALLAAVRLAAQTAMGQRRDTYLTQMARIALENRPPLTFLGRFQLIDAEHADQPKGINLKRAMRALADFTRIYALKYDIEAVNTEERLQALLKAEILTSKEFHELHQAFFYMMRLRLSYQSNQLQSGLAAGNVLPPGNLTKIERVTLREIFRVIEKYQKRLSIVFLGILNG